MPTQIKPKFAYFQGEIVPFEQATVSVMNHALNYGTAVFGGLRGYWNAEQEQMYLFRPLDHFKRIIQSAALLRMEIEQSAEELTSILVELLRKEGYQENCYIRPLVYKSAEIIGVRLHDLPHELTIFGIPFGRYVEKEEGLHVCFSSWRRVDDNAIPARGKISGAYANSALIKSDAVLSGYDEALVLTASGHLSEASAANVMIVRKGELITPPITSDLLEGITRSSVLQLASDVLNLPVVEREIDRTEIYVADEILMCGTGMQIAAVTQVEHRRIGTGKMGPVTQALRDQYFKLVSGQIPQFAEWLMPVYENQAVSIKP